MIGWARHERAIASFIKTHSMFQDRCHFRWGVRLPTRDEPSLLPFAVRLSTYAGGRLGDGHLPAIYRATPTNNIFLTSTCVLRIPYRSICRDGRRPL